MFVYGITLQQAKYLTLSMGIRSGHDKQSLSQQDSNPLLCVTMNIF